MITIKGNFTRFHIWFILYCILSVSGFLGFFVVAPIIEGGFEEVFEVIGQGYFVLIIVGVLFAIAAAISYFMQYELYATETKVIGKTLLGKRVDLPITHISAIGMGWGKRITITSSSGRVMFFGVLNQEEINEKLTSMMKSKEERTSKSSTIGNADELVKYKKLLDDGIISQEEFDAKKKQLLGL